jgi:hypothetical protein
MPPARCRQRAVRWHGRGAERSDGEELRIGATARGSCGSTRRQDGEGGDGETGRGAPLLEWTVVLDGMRKEAVAVRWGGGRRMGRCGGGGHTNVAG